MHARLVRLLSSFAVGSALVALSACGGGSGGDSTVTIPGTLSAIALEGDLAPGTGPGLFGPFGALNLVDVADDGWTAFTADVTGGTTNKALFCRRPDGAVVNVFSRGETVPGPRGGTGTILDFGKIWMCPGTGTGGIVVAYVSLLGGTAEAIIAARVPASGLATEKSGIISRGLALPAGLRGSGAPGNVASLDVDLIQVDDQGDVFFIAAGTNGLSGVWTDNRFGAHPIAPISVSGDSAPVTGTIGTTFDGLGIDGDGSVIAYAVNVNMGPIHAIIATNSSSSNGVIVAADGNQPPNVGARVFQNVHAGGPLYVTAGGGAAFCVWEGDLDGSAPDKGVFSRQVMGGSILTLGSLQSIAVPGQSITGLGVGAFMTTIEPLDGAVDPNRIPLLVGVAGGTATRAIFSAPDAVTTEGVWHDGQTAPGSPTTTFATSLPSLTLPGIKHQDRAGSLAYSAVLANAQSGVYWEILSGGVFLRFQVTRSGDPAPAIPGGTFGSFISASPVVTAATFVVFTATVAGGTSPSGLFIQG